ncbi:MAG: hypothetical protein GY861_21690 [bacterium]|nr:hypothetical protein [bacterium]
MDCPFSFIAEDNGDIIISLKDIILSYDRHDTCNGETKSVRGKIWLGDYKLRLGLRDDKSVSCTVVSSPVGQKNGCHPHVGCGQHVCLGSISVRLRRYMLNKEYKRCSGLMYNFMSVCNDSDAFYKTTVWIGMFKRKYKEEFGKDYPSERCIETFC